MRVLLVSNIYPPEVHGGYELLAFDVVAALKERGHTVEVLTSGQVANDVEDGVTRTLELTYPFGSPTAPTARRHLSLGPGQDRAFSECVQRFNPDVALFFSLRRLGVHLLYSAERHHLPSVCCINDTWPADFGDIANTQRGRLADVLATFVPKRFVWPEQTIRRGIFISHWLADAIEDSGLVAERRVVAGQGVDPELFRRQSIAHLSVDLKSVAPKGPQRLLYTGRVHPTKGIEFLLKTLALLCRQGDKSTLTIVGGGDDNYIHQLKMYSDELGIFDRVQWGGQVEREYLPAIYCSHDIFLFAPEWEEPMGLNWMEALSCELPAVLRPTGGMRELVEHEENALVVSTPEEAVASITRIRTDGRLKLKLAKGGLRLLDERANLSKYVDTIESELALATMEPGKSGTVG